MDRDSLDSLEFSILSRRLAVLRRRSTTAEAFHRLSPTLLDKMEEDHWALLSCLASLYTTREICDDERLDGLMEAKRRAQVDDDDDEWVDEELDEEHQS
jgi:hypothetical protein